MIEKALRKRFEPIVKRHRQLHLAWRLSVWWCIWALAALAIWGAYHFWGWSSPAVIMSLGVATVIATVVVLHRSQRIEPDYHALARAIE
nr:hypothetical protein [Planctomycetota bacterium]